MALPIDEAGSIAAVQLFSLASGGRNTITQNTRVLVGAAINVTDAQRPEDTEVVDTTVPTIDAFSPSPETPVTAFEPIAFSVTDASELGRVLIAVRYKFIDRVDLAFDGTDFCGGYTGTKTSIDGGFRYQIQRPNGWLDSPTIQVFAVDAEGNRL